MGRPRKGMDWFDSPDGAVTLEVPCTMCAFYHKIHWSVVAIAVNVICLILYTTAVATPNWAQRSYDTYEINTGLFQSCTGLNDTCYDTHIFFAMEDEKGALLASAVINVFALIGMWLFFALSVFFLCGLFEEKQLATGAIVTSYLSGLLAVIGTITFAVSIKSLSYSLSWSFVLAVLGFCVNFAAGVLMCVGRNISTKTRKKKKTGSRADELGPVEEVQMEETETTRRKIWATGGVPEPRVKKSAMRGGASNY